MGRYCQTAFVQVASAAYLNRNVMKNVKLLHLSLFPRRLVAMARLMGLIRGAARLGIPCWCARQLSHRRESVVRLAYISFPTAKDLSAAQAEESHQNMSCVYGSMWHMLGETSVGAGVVAYSAPLWCLGAAG